MASFSILWREVGPDGDQAPDRGEESDAIVDLGFDQIFEAVLCGREEHDLAAFLHLPLQHADAIAYRHEVFRDLEEPQIWRPVEALCEGPWREEPWRECASTSARPASSANQYQTAHWFLRAVGIFPWLARAGEFCPTLPLRSCLSTLGAWQHGSKLNLRVSLPECVRKEGGGALTNELPCLNSPSSGAGGTTGHRIAPRLRFPTVRVATTWDRLRDVRLGGALVATSVQWI